MEDGYRLPLRRWGDPGRARGLVLALHGFNDYGNAFAGLGDYLWAQGLLVYAVDQRGFGTTAQRGRWPGEERLVADLLALVDLLRERHPGLPITLVGESMGGAVLLAAAPHLRDVQGLVLIAPAVWSRDTMPAYQRLLLAAAVRTAPRARAHRPGPRHPAHRQRPLLARLQRRPPGDQSHPGRRPLGRRQPHGPGRPRQPTAGHPPAPALRRARPDHPQGGLLHLAPAFRAHRPDLRLVLYGKGWHMLTRDRQGAWVLADIAAWIQDPPPPCPPGKRPRPMGSGSRACAPRDEPPTCHRRRPAVRNPGEAMRAPRASPSRAPPPIRVHLRSFADLEMFPATMPSTLPDSEE